MSNSKGISKNPAPSIVQRARQTWHGLTTPHPSIIAIAEQRRAELLSILTLILSALFIIALLSGQTSYGIFLILTGITFTSYVLSRTKYYRLGAYLFTYIFTSISFIRIYQGTPESLEAAIVSTVHVSLILSSVLLSQRGLLGLIILSTVATFTAPLYSNIPPLATDNIGRTGGIVFVLGVILYSINNFRENVDREKLKELTEINNELEDVKINLEVRVDQRTLEIQDATQQIQKRVARLQTITEISQEISANVDLKLEELLARITRNISEKLGYYHVGIFLMDEKHEYAVLLAANSKGGQQMLARQHQLKVGGVGVVGYVAQSALPRIALDTGSDAVFFNNPNLPETRSEIALPLLYGTSNIGVLDVQSATPSAFNNEDMNTLNTLANQIAIVVRNLQIIDETEFDSTSKRFGKYFGGQLSRKEKERGYAYAPDGIISSVLPEKKLVLEKSLASGETLILGQPQKGISPSLAIPVKFRDRVIGIIQIESVEQNRKWTEDEVAMVQAISERAAFALENARLFENATRRAEQEETIAQVTSQIGSSTDFNHILQTTIQELGQALGVSRSFIQLGTPPENGNENNGV